MKTALFSGVYGYYNTFRPGIPLLVVKKIFQEIGEKPDKVLDVGCGTGQVALAMNGHCREIVCVDADAQMLEQARETVGQLPNTRVSFVHAAAEELSALKDRLGFFDLATFCRAFHWMQHTRVLDALDRLLTPHGVLAICSDGSWWTGRAPWQQAITEIIRGYLGKERRAGGGYFRVAQTPWKIVLKESPFAYSKSIEIAETRRWDIPGILGYLCSTSYASPALFGEKLDLFQQEVSQTLLALQPNGEFIENAVFKLVLASRNAIFR